MSLLKVNEVQNYNGSSLTLTASTVSTSAQLNTGGNISVTGSINVSDDSTTRSNLGLGSIATQDSDNVTVTGGTATLGALTVSGSDSGDLVRITQTGSGNALVVEDSTNPDSTPFVVDSSGNVGIGTIPDKKLHVIGSDGATSFTSYGTRDFLVVENNQNTNIQIISNSSNTGNILFSDESASGQGRIAYSHSNNELSFYSDGTERMRINSNGNAFHSSNGYFGRIDTTYTSGGEYAVNLYAGSSTDTSQLRARATASASLTAFVITVGGNNKIRFQSNGNGYWDGTTDAGAADYAEYFEWLDGNPNNEDRRGYSVVLETGKIRIATSSDNAEDIIGIISGRPAIVGDTASLGWQGKFATDEFGARLTRPITVYSWTDGNGNELQYRHDSIPENVTVPDDASSEVRYEDYYSDEYDPTVEYAPRSERPEWSPVGLLGKLRMRTGQPTGNRWIKLKDESDTIELWFVR